MATKPKRISYKAVAGTFDGIQLPRVQNLNTSIDRPVENVLELANKGVVEKYVDIADVTVNMTTYDTTTDTIGVLAGRYDSASSASPILNAGAGLNDLTTTSELGHITIGNVTTPDFDTMQRTCGAMVATDILYHVEDPANNGQLLAACHIPRATVTNIGLRYSVDGFMEESYDFAASQKVWYFGPNFSNAWVAKGMATGGDNNSFVVSAASTVRESFSGVSGFKVVHNTLEYKNTSAYDGAESYGITLASTGEIAAKNYATWTVVGVGGVANPTFKQDDYITLVYYDTDTALTFPNMTSALYSSYPGGVKGAFIEIYLNPVSTGTSARFLRCQSCDITVPLARNPLDQIGDSQAFFQSLTYPIDVTFTVDVIASDLEMWRMAGGKSAMDESAIDEEVHANELDTDMELMVFIYNNRNTHDGTTLLKTVKVTNAKLTSDSRDTAVGNDASETFGFAADNFEMWASGN